MRSRIHLPLRGWLGFALVLVAWPLNWTLPGLRTHALFFPLWLGYVLVVDALAAVRTGTSHWTRSRLRFVGLFLLSVPVWWLFELFNLRLENWRYLGREQFTDAEYFWLSSLSFSTVVPAVLGTAELMRGFGWIDRFADGPRIRPTRQLEIGLAAAGLAMLALMLAWPRVFYPFVWLCGVALLEPVAQGLRRRGLLDDLARGDWRPCTALWSGVLVCGFFWEMWNSLSYPKWIYDVPGLGFAKIFEMPALGYLGYLPFALEIFLLRQLVLPEPRDEPTAGGPSAA